jgi:hypothetical protein
VIEDALRVIGPRRLSVVNRIQARLESLRQELEKGQAELQKVEAQRAYLQEAVLRISGAVQVLEELLEMESTAPEGEICTDQEAATQTTT